MYFSTKGPVVTKLVDPGQMEFMLHTMAIPSTDNFVRSARCSWKVMR